MENIKNYLPGCYEYANYLKIVCNKFNISIDEARKKCGLLTIKQLDELIATKRK